MKEKTAAVITAATAAVIVFFLTGCHVMMSTPSGIREYGRYQNGQIVTGKSAPNVADEYHITQRDTDLTSLEKLKLQLEGLKNGGN